MLSGHDCVSVCLDIFTCMCWLVTFACMCWLDIFACMCWLVTFVCMCWLGIFVCVCWLETFACVCLYRIHAMRCKPVSVYTVKLLYAYVCTRVPMFTCIHICVLYTNTRTHIIYSFTDIRRHIKIYTCIVYTHIPMCAHTETYTNMRTNMNIH